MRRNMKENRRRTGSLKRMLLLRFFMCILWVNLLCNLGIDSASVMPSFLLCAHGAQQTEENTKPSTCEILVLPVSDGSVFVTYHIEQKVSKRAVAGVKAFNVPLSTEKVKNVKSLDSAAKYISFEMDEERNSYLHIGLDRVYKPGERIVMDFQVRLLSIYEVDETTNTMVYHFFQTCPATFLPENCVLAWDAAFVEEATQEKIRFEQLLSQYPDFEKLASSARELKTLSKQDVTSKEHCYYFFQGAEDGTLSCELSYPKKAFSNQELRLKQYTQMSIPRQICAISILICLIVGIYLCLSSRERFRREAVFEISDLYYEVQKKKGRVPSLEEEKEKPHIGIQAVHDEEKEIRKHREKMLPRISNNAVEYAISRQKFCFVFVWLAFVFLVYRVATLGFHSSILKVLCILWAVIFVKLYVIDTLYFELGKDDGFLLEEDGVRFVKSRRSKGILYEYGEVIEAVQKGRVKYTGTALVVRCKHYVLRFFYEIGDTAAFKRMEKSYAVILEKTKAELPPFTAELAGFMDQRYYHRHGVRTSAIVMATANAVAAGLMLYKKDQMTPLCIFWVIFISIITNFALAEMWRRALHLRATIIKMKENYQKASSDGWIDNHILWIAGGVSALFLCFNFWAMWMFWN